MPKKSDNSLACSSCVQLAKPITIPDELIERCDGPNQFEKFDQLFRKVISVPRPDILKEKTKWKRVHTRKNQSKKSA